MKSRAAVAFEAGQPLQIAKVQEGDSVAVFGLGGIGLAVIQSIRSVVHY